MPQESILGTVQLRAKLLHLSYLHNGSHFGSLTVELFVTCTLTPYQHAFMHFAEPSISGMVDWTGTITAWRRSMSVKSANHFM